MYWLIDFQKGAWLRKSFLSGDSSKHIPSKYVSLNKNFCLNTKIPQVKAKVCSSQPQKNDHEFCGRNSFVFNEYNLMEKFTLLFLWKVWGELNQNESSGVYHNSWLLICNFCAHSILFSLYNLMLLCLNFIFS